MRLSTRDFTDYQGTLLATPIYQPQANAHCVTSRVYPPASRKKNVTPYRHWRGFDTVGLRLVNSWKTPVNEKQKTEREREAAVREQTAEMERRARAEGLDLDHPEGRERYEELVRRAARTKK